MAISPIINQIMFLAFSRFEKYILPNTREARNSTAYGSTITIIYAQNGYPSFQTIKKFNAKYGIISKLTETLKSLRTIFFKISYSNIDVIQNNTKGIAIIAIPSNTKPCAKKPIAKIMKSQNIGGISSNILNITKSLKFLRTIFLKVKTRILCVLGSVYTLIRLSPLTPKNLFYRGEMFCIGLNNCLKYRVDILGHYPKPYWDLSYSVMA
jgi:hypothetical protein